VKFRIANLAVPAVVLGPPVTDTRRLGVHFNSFVYVPPK
jgi:hypothetical protein